MSEFKDAKDFYESLETNKNFTKLTSTGISTDYNNVFEFADAYHKAQMLANGDNTESEPSINYDSVLVTRYFVVAYIGTMPTGQCNGSINMWSESGYLTRARATQIIKEHNTGIKDVVIANVTELNKEDFEAWRTNGC